MFYHYQRNKNAYCQEYGNAARFIACALKMVIGSVAHKMFDI